MKFVNTYLSVKARINRDILVKLHKKTMLLTTFIILSILSLLLVSCKKEADPVSSTPTPDTSVRSHTIHYAVQGWAKTGDITYTIPIDGTSKHVPDASIPWSVYSTSKSGQSFALLVHGKSDGTGYFVGYVFIDDKVYKEEIAYNPNAVLVLSGIVP